MKIIITNLQKKMVPGSEMNQTVKLVLNKAAEVYGLHPRTEVGLSWVDDEYIRKLNYEYRGRDAPTDVLSFAMNECASSAGVPGISGGPPEADFLLGDIVISLETAGRQAKEYGHSLLREVAFLTIHGMLHLLGYDHLEKTEQNEMQKEEEHILSCLNITREIEVRSL